MHCCYLDMRCFNVGARPADARAGSVAPRLCPGLNRAFRNFESIAVSDPTEDAYVLQGDDPVNRAEGNDQVAFLKKTRHLADEGDHRPAP
jgi:hypothetical protein